MRQQVRHIEIFDTGVAFLAGLIIVPGVFAFSGGDAAALNAGPSLMFIRGLYKVMILVVCPIFMLAILLTPFFVSL